MDFKKIGSYLVESQSCNQQVIESALKKQITLEHEGIYKPIGQIIIESGNLDPMDLELMLRHQIKDMLRSVELFKSLSPELISKIAGVAECVAFPEGEIIIHEGDQGDSFYQVISGLIRVFHVSEDGVDVTLNTLGPGESFGEMALLTGEPRSASVDIQEAGSLLIISKQAFDQLVSEIPGFSLVLSKILSDRLSRGTSKLVRASATEKAYQRFVTEQSSGFEAKLIGRSKAIKRLQDRVAEVSENDEAVLILGESGTEKGDVARLIHFSSQRKNGPFLTVDIKSVNVGRTVDRPESSDPVRLELAQDSTLFGHTKGALPFAPERRLGLFQVGDGGTVVIENVEYLSANIQRQLVDFIKHGRFLPLGGQTSILSSIRIIATSSVDLEKEVQINGFNKQLFDLLGGGKPLIVPPLSKRKKDLRQITEYLLKLYSSQTGKSITGIDLDVYKSIMTYDWPGNTDELRAVIRRAVNLTQNSRLTSEDILIGMVPQLTGGLRFNLLRLDRIRQLFLSNAFPNIAQLIAGFFFVFIICLGFWGSQKLGSNISLELTWGLWEPLVVISCILAARIWCAVCPVGALSSLISHKYGLKRNIPSFIRSYGGYLAAVGIGLIFLSEVVFNMPASPRATAMLILSIFLPAVMLALIYRRRIWCRFLCPLGKLVGFFSRCSPLELRANYNICNNDCRDHSCYVGNEYRPGCPVFEAPFVFHNNQECILCGYCIKSCPHQSPVLNLRAPGQELWTFRKPEPIMALLGPLVMGTQLFRGLEKTVYFQPYITALNQQWIFHTLFMVITTFLAFLFVRMTSNVVFDTAKTTSQERSSLMSYAFVPLIVSFELGFHFERLIRLGGRLLPTLGSYFGFNWDFLIVDVSPGLIKVHQIVFVLIGVLASKAVLTNIFRSHLDSSLTGASFRHQWPILLFAMVYIALFWVS
jgi:DNA-binding NtrC family response regulator/ferredoxin